MDAYSKKDWYLLLSKGVFWFHKKLNSLNERLIISEILHLSSFVFVSLFLFYSLDSDIEDEKCTLLHNPLMSFELLNIEISVIWTRLPLFSC